MQYAQQDSATYHDIVRLVNMFRLLNLKMGNSYSPRWPERLDIFDRK